MNTSLMTDTTRSTPARQHRALLLAGAAVGLALLALFGLLGGLRAARSGAALPGVTVGEVDVGGLGGERLREAIGAAGLAERTVTATRGNQRVVASGAELGYRLDVDATEHAVMRRGRQLNPFTALGDHLRSFGGTITVAPVQHVDAQELDAWVASAAERLGKEPVEGDLVIEGATITRVDPESGAVVPTEPLREQAVEALLHGGERTFEVASEDVAPETTVADVDAIVGLAERAVSGPVTLSRNGAALTWSPEEIAALLRVELADGDLHLLVDAESLDAWVSASERRELESDPVDASIEISGGAVSISESLDGFRFDATAAAAQLLELATGEGERTGELEGEIIEPQLSAEELRALNVTEQVSSFTTSYSCCQSRVQNIHRIAELVDGALIKPGESFSVNEHVGRRTREKGFTDGGAIQAGEFVEEVGGGVSQFATTMYNAAFFGGYAIPEYKAHSYYISRYPIGREATLNYPNVDLRVRNNSPHGLVVKTSVTSTSVTVAFWGTKWVEVSDITGQRRNVTAPPTRYRENPELRPGSERVVQSGREGFDITVVRVLTFPDGREGRENINTRYLPEPRIIERNSSTATPEPEEEEGPPAEEEEPPAEPQPSPQPPPDDGGEEPGSGDGG